MPLYVALILILLLRHIRDQFCQGPARRNYVCSGVVDTIHLPIDLLHEICSRLYFNKWILATVIQSLIFYISSTIDSKVIFMTKISSLKTNYTFCVYYSLK